MGRAEEGWNIIADNYEDGSHGERTQSTVNPTHIVITLTRNNSYNKSVELYTKTDSDGDLRSVHYLINTDGTIVQLVKDCDMAYHAGIQDYVQSLYNQNNSEWKKYIRYYSDGGYPKDAKYYYLENEVLTETNRDNPQTELVGKSDGRNWPHYSYWNDQYSAPVNYSNTSSDPNEYSIGIALQTPGGTGKFPDGLYIGLDKLLTDLCSRYGIPRNRTHIVGHEEVNPVESWGAPGNGFDWIRALATETDLSFPIDVGNGINVTFENMEAFYKHIEKEFEGGYFPIGSNSVWHGGVHLCPSQNIPSNVYAIAEGRIIAARLLPTESKSVKNFGGINFIITEHVFDDQKIFSLCMHLHFLSSDDSLLNSIPWITEEGDSETSRILNQELFGRVSSDVVNDLSIPIKAGELLWKSGKAKSVNNKGKPYLVNLLHWEVFSEHKLFETSDRSGIWRYVKDPDDNFLVDWNDLVDLEDSGDSEYLKDIFSDELSNNISRRELRDFYTDNIDGKAAQLRTYGCHFISEWGVTNAELLIENIKKRGFTPPTIDDVAPYLWWEDAVNGDEGIPSDAHVWHYNPVSVIRHINITERIKLREDSAESTWPDDVNELSREEGHNYIRLNGKMRSSDDEINKSFDEIADFAINLNADIIVVTDKDPDAAVDVKGDLAHTLLFFIRALAISNFDDVDDFSTVRTSAMMLRSSADIVGLSAEIVGLSADRISTSADMLSASNSYYDLLYASRELIAFLRSDDSIDSQGRISVVDDLVNTLQFYGIVAVVHDMALVIDSIKDIDLIDSIKNIVTSSVTGFIDSVRSKFNEIESSFENMELVFNNFKANFDEIRDGDTNNRIRDIIIVCSDAIKQDIINAMNHIEGLIKKNKRIAGFILEKFPSSDVKSSLTIPLIFIKFMAWMAKIATLTSINKIGNLDEIKEAIKDLIKSIKSRINGVRDAAIKHELAMLTFRIFNLIKYRYDYEQNLVYSTTEAFQQKGGYVDFYDKVINEKLHFNIDYFDIPFTYKGADDETECHIRGWKGNYWGAKGGEIGYYVGKNSFARAAEVHSEEEVLGNGFAASEDNMISMGFVLTDSNMPDFKIHRYMEPNWWAIALKPESQTLSDKPFDTRRFKMEGVIDFDDLKNTGFTAAEAGDIADAFAKTLSDPAGHGAVISGANSTMSFTRSENGNKFWFTYQ